MFSCLCLALTASLAYSQTITGLYLVDTTTEMDLHPLKDGGIIDLLQAGTFLTIRATVDDSSKIRNVVLKFDKLFERTDAFPPYSLTGDTDQPLSTLAEVGIHTISVKANSRAASPGHQLSATFTVVRGKETLAPTPAPLGKYDVPPYNYAPNGALTGELKKWHKITVGFVGPSTNEREGSARNLPNPFEDYRLDVFFTHKISGKSYSVPGYYAANGNAANTQATAGFVWLVHFCPDEIGDWEYTAMFKTGIRVAQRRGGKSAGYFDGAFGSFSVGPTDKKGRDLRGKGRLQYVGAHHLRFAETGEWFLKVGADSPENLLAYEDFDNTPNNGGYRKTWSPHIQDYREGDPTWNNGKGIGLIGAINYLSDKGMNAVSFLTLTIKGDDKNVFPFVSDKPDDWNSFDVSKLAQWEVVFEHADRMGMFLHFKTQEEENDQLLDGGKLRSQRKLYYRELIAHFGHHLALNWNLGEGNSNSSKQRKAFSRFFTTNDPYGHPTVVHTAESDQENVYRQLLGIRRFHGASLYSRPMNTFSDTLKWVKVSAAERQKWVVTNDEQFPANKGVRPDSVDFSHDKIRKHSLWGNIMAGGAGVEYFFGYKFHDSDLTCENWRTREAMWDQSRYALEFFSKHEIPFWEMTNIDGIVSGKNHALSDPDAKCIVIFLRDGGKVDVNLAKYPNASYSLKWYDPRNGGALQAGSVPSVSADTDDWNVGSPPSDQTGDWVLLLNKE